MPPSDPSRAVPPLPVGASCIMCDAPLTAPRAAQSRLCMSAVCAGQYAMLRPHQKCVECGRALTWPQQATKVCDDARCRVIRLAKHPMAVMRAAYGRMQGAAEARRNRSLGARGVPRDRWSEWPVALVPKFRASPSRLSNARRDNFTASLTAELGKARAGVAAGKPLPGSDTVPVVPAPSAREQELHAVLGATCGACRGSCCQAGADHAFLREHAMQTYIQRFPDLANEEILSRYLSYLPARTLKGGCVYQEATGCALPRDMRSEICNRYHCSGLLSIRDACGDTAPIQAFVVHREGTQISGGRCLPIFAG